MLQDVDADGNPGTRAAVVRQDLVAAVAARERDHPRWVWDDTAVRYSSLLAAGLRVERCHDLRLCHAILRRSALCRDSALASASATAWDAPRASAPEDDDVGLFADPRSLAPARDGGDALTELRLQLAAVAGSDAPGRLRLLLAAESTGALIAAEMRHDGMPWRVDVHDALLTSLLGDRPASGARPSRLEALADQVRELLGQPTLNCDSQPDLLRALRAAGLAVTTTRTSEIRGLDHPVTAPLLEYKKLARLLSANGWA